MCQKACQMQKISDNYDSKSHSAACNNKYEILSDD